MDKLLFINEVIDGKNVEMGIDDGEVYISINKRFYRTESSIKIALWIKRKFPSLVREYQEKFPGVSIYAVPQDCQGGIKDGVNRRRAATILNFTNKGKRIDILVKGVWESIECLELNV